MARGPLKRWWDVEIVRHLPPDPRAAGEARRALAALESEIGEETLATLRLLASELVTTVVTCGRSSPDERIEFAAFAARGRAYLEVSDPGPGFEPGSDPQHETAGPGWRLQLLAALSERWGTERNDRTVVWCEVGAGWVAPQRS